MKQEHRGRDDFKADRIIVRNTLYILGEKMSWLRNSPLRTSFSKQRSRNSPPKDADPSACYDSFCKHWQQTYEIILHSLVRKKDSLKVSFFDYLYIYTRVSYIAVKTDHIVFISSFFFVIFIYSVFKRNNLIAMKFMIKEYSIILCI